MSSDSSFAKGETSSQGRKNQKAADMRKQLGVGQSRGNPTPGTISDKTHLLIVNGGGHEAFLGNFFGLVRVFEKQTRPDFGGEFWTCENPMTYFDIAPHTDIKFGGDTVLRKFEVVHQEFGGGNSANWQYVAPADLLNHVLAWMERKYDAKEKDRVKEGDSVIMILLAHGHWSTATRMSDGCQLGTNTLLVDKFVEKLKKFPRTVQVNVVSNSCYSGLFTEKVKADGQKDRWIQAAASSSEQAWPSPKSPSNRYRNGLFVAGLVRSLGGLQTATDSPSLRTVKEDLANATQSHPDPQKRSVPTDYHTYDELKTKVASLLFRRFADFPVMSENVAARRRNELEQSYLNRYPTPSSPNTTGESFALAVIRGEYEAFGQDTSNYSEGNFHSAMGDPERYTADILRSLLWRGRQQSNVFQIFMMLCLHGFCDLSALSKPVDFYKTTPTNSWMNNNLMSFSSFGPLWETGRKMVPLEHVHIEWQHFNYPIIWLGVMLTRSAANIGDTFDAMMASKFLGTFNKAHYDQVPNLGRDWAPDPNDSVSSKDAMPCIGMMLPSGIDIEDPGNSLEGLQRKFYQHLDKIEKAFGEYLLIPINQRFSLEYQRDKEVDLRDWEP